MAACDECKALDGQLSRHEPHPALKFLDAKKYRAMGHARGRIEHYKCSACGSEFSRDIDSQDKEASWMIKK